MPNYSSAIVIGHVTADAEAKGGATSVCRFTVAVSWKSKGEDSASFIPVVCFGKTAEWAGTNVKKGNAVLVAGRINENRWTTKEGDKRSRLEVVADRVQALSYNDKKAPSKEEEF